MSNDGCFWGGFTIGAVVMLVLTLFFYGIRDASRNRDSEILRIEYKNTNNGASREMVEDMVKTHFPSSKWENVEYDCSKNRVKVEFSNP